MEEDIEKFNIKEEKIDLEEMNKQVDELIEQDKKLRQEGELADNTLLAPVIRKELTEADLLIFNKSENGTWTYGEWHVYTDGVSKYIKENPKDKTNNSRDIFRDWLGKKAQIQFQREDFINRTEQA